MAMTTFVTNGIAVGDWVEYNDERYMCMAIPGAGFSIDIEHPRTRARFSVNPHECTRVPGSPRLYQVTYYSDEDGAYDDEDYHYWASSSVEAVKLFKRETIDRQLQIHKVYELREVDRDIWEQADGEQES
jgi:hypothetical protein